MFSSITTVTFEDLIETAKLKDGSNFGLEKLDKNKIDKTLKNFETKYITHNNGLFIVAPSGTGKTYFCKKQRDPHWIDGDNLWIASGAHPNRAWWLESEEVMNEIDKRSDIVTYLAKEKGYWLMGASNNWLRPDAIVIPDWEEHKRLIKLREEGNYDGGATLDKLEQVEEHRKWILEWVKRDVPVFKNIEEAVNYLTK